MKKYAFILTMILTGSMFFNIQTCSVEAKETKTVKKVNEIVQDISYVYKDKDGKEVTKTVREPVACSISGCNEHSEDKIIEGLKQGKKITDIVKCKSGSDLYNIKVPVKYVEKKKIKIKYKTLSELKFYSVQGSCYKNNCLYIAFSDKEKTDTAQKIKESTGLGVVNLTAIVKLKFANGKCTVAQVEFIKGMEQIDDAINYMGHANDMTYFDGKLHTTWYEVAKKSNGKKVTKKKFTLGYIDVSDQVKGMATNIGDAKDSKNKSIFGIAKYGKKSFAVGIRDTSKGVKRYVEFCTYKKAKSDGKYSYVIKKKLFDLKKEKDNYTIPQCMASDGKYIYVNKYSKKKKEHNNCIQVYKNNKHKKTIIIKDPTIVAPNGKKKSLKNAQWEMEGFGRIKGKNNFYCVMAMPETKGAGKLLEKGKQAYLCTFTMKN